jgi:hypothetical protein
MRPGTRVVSHQYAMSEWPPDQSVQVQGRHVYLWVVPARLAGVWDFQDSQGATFTIDLHQTFGSLSGEITRGGVRPALLSPTLRGVELRFAFDAGGTPTRFSGTVRGEEITGLLATGSAARTAVGRLRGAQRATPWADMPPVSGSTTTASTVTADRAGHDVAPRGAESGGRMLVGATEFATTSTSRPDCMLPGGSRADYRAGDLDAERRAMPPAQRVCAGLMEWLVGSC